MLVTDKPENLPTTNALDDIPADLLGPVPAEIRLGANVLMVMEKPPEVGDVITVSMRLKVKREAKDLGGEEGSELVHFRGCKIVAAWLKGDPEPPNADDDQGALIDEDGNAVDYGDGDAQESDTDIHDGVDRPGFSDGDQ